MFEKSRDGAFRRRRPTRPAAVAAFVLASALLGGEPLRASARDAVAGDEPSSGAGPDRPLRGDRRRPRRSARRGFGPGAPRLELLEAFDADGNGRLEGRERARARERVRAERRPRRGRRRGPPGFPPRGVPFGPPGPGAGEDEGPRDDERAEAVRLEPADVDAWPGRALYDPDVLRTLFLYFETPEWEEELADFWHTDVEVPADLVVDGREYSGVGVRFRGNSSFFGVPPGRKRSIHVGFDLARPEQDLLGHDTLNLLNAHDDPSFLREVLFSHVARRHLPAPRANLVRVVIQGENHGVFANVE